MRGPHVTASESSVRIGCDYANEGRHRDGVIGIRTEKCAQGVACKALNRPTTECGTNNGFTPYLADCMEGD